MEDYLIVWPELTGGTLIRRYKRFMADIMLENGRVVTAHCPNSGRMLGCSEPGRPVLLSLSENKKRLYPHTWEIIDMPGSLVAVNTLRANQISKAAILRGLIPELSGYGSLRPEVKAGDHSRIDLLLQNPGKRPALVEVKSCTYAEEGLVMFPDAVTERGLRHLQELTKAMRKGYRCVTLFIVQRMDAQHFMPADHIDPAFGAGFRKAVRAGVEVLVYIARIDHKGIALDRRIPCLI